MCYYKVAGFLSLWIGLITPIHDLACGFTDFVIDTVQCSAMFPDTLPNASMPKKLRDAIFGHVLGGLV